MTFAQIPKEAILQLKGLRFHLFAVVQMEMFEGGGVCKLTPRELSEKYDALGNYDSLCRYRKQMIASGWLVEVVGGIVTKTFNNTDISSVEPKKPTDEISVETEKTLIKYQSTDEISVEDEKELIFNQSGTDEISGTPIANNDLDFKDLNTQTHTNARPRGEKFDPVSCLLAKFPHLSDCLTDTQKNKIRDTVQPDFKIAWHTTVDIYESNYNPKLERYLPEKVGNLLSVFNSEKKKLEKQNAKNPRTGKTNSDSGGHKPKSDNYEIKQKRDYSAFDNFDPNEAFKIK